MSSILTNNSAMVALQTLKSVNGQLGNVQSQISTGLEVGSAKDNAAVFSIAQVMKSDVAGFEAVSDSLSLGSSTLSVASAATSSIGETLEEIKTKIVSAQESNVDRGKLDNEINSLVEQVTSVLSAAQFNGLNLIDGSAGADLDILSSLDRGSDGSVSTSQINVDLSATNLSTDVGAVAAATFTGTTGVSAAADKFATTADAAGTADVTFADADAGEALSITVGDNTYEYTSAVADDQVAAAYAIRDQINAANEDGVTGISATATAAGVLTITNGTADDVAISGAATAQGAGGLAELANINVNGTDAQRTEALTNIETMINTVIDAQATFGTAEKRVEMQGDFMSKLTDSFKSGIGSLVDADLETTSARLQALQVQQQLGTQALSIANSGPQQLVSLFR